MKKIPLLFALVCLGLFAKAQTTAYGPAYFGIGGFKDSKGVSGDLTFEMYGRVTTTSNFFVGLRLQCAVTPIVGYTSVCFTGDYYFTRPENSVRIFAGGGLGGFIVLKAGKGTSDNLFNIDSSSSNFGFFPRVGIEAGRFRLSAEYDFTGGPDNYAAVNLGFFFGKGKKK